MAFVVTSGTDGIHFYADEAAPSTPVGAVVVDAAYQGSKCLFSLSKWLEDHAAVLGGITDAGGGIIPTAEQIGNIHAHNNFAVLQTIPSPTAAQASGYMVAPIAEGQLGIILAPSAPATPTNYRGGLSGSADLTGNSTGNSYLDGGTDILNGDLFKITSSGTLTTNTGTNVAVLVGDEVFINTTTTDSTIIDSHLDVISPAGGVSSIDVGGGVLTGAVVIDLDDIADGGTYVKATQAELDKIATNETAITTKLDTSVWDAAPAKNITDSGRNAVITTSEGNVISELDSPASPDDNNVWGQVSGVGQWVPSASMGPTDPVLSVNGETPDGAGNVVNTTAHVATDGTNLYVTGTEKSDWNTAKTQAASANSTISRWQAIESLTIAVGGTTVCSVSNSIRKRLILTGDTTLAFPTNLNVSGGEVLEPYLRIIVKQDGTGGWTLDFASGYEFPGGAKPVISTAPNAKDILNFEFDSPTTAQLVSVQNFLPSP